MPDTVRLTTALGDRYRIERELGAGGMATVYLAHDVKHGRDVALKVLRPELAAVLGAERFLNEVCITAQLDHPHILTLIDSGADDTFLWYVLPYVRGESLRTKLTREKQLGLSEALAITKQIAAALDYAHRHGVIHRDIKPENILLFEGEAMLADFGIALAVKEAGGNRLTETGLSLGTPQYMSPEQATGDRQLDARSDVYSLGAVLYEMLAGEPPVTGPTAQAMIAKLMTERPTRLRVVRDTVPEGIENAVAQALAKTPADRFASAADLAEALGRAADAPSTAVPPPGRPRWLVGVSAAAVLVVLGGVGWLALGRSRVGATAFTPQLVQLTTDGNARLPQLSPDGTRLAYVARDCDSLERCTERLVVRDTGGAGSATLMRASSFWFVRWATGGRFLVVTRVDPQGFGVYAVPTLGGEPRLLGCCFGVPIGATDTLLLSPYFAAPTDSVVWLRFITVSDGLAHDSVPVRRVGVVNVGYPAGAGGRIVVVRHVSPTTGSLWLLHRTGRVTDSMPEITQFGSAPLWSPGGDALIWASARGRMFWGTPSPSVLLRRLITSEGRFAGSPDTLLRLQPGSDLAALQADGTALLTQGPVDAEAWALERPRPGRLGFSTRRVAASTAGLQAQLSRDGSHVWLTHGYAGSGSGRRDVIVPFAGGPERAFTAPAGDIYAWDWTRPVSSGLLLAARDSLGHARLVEVSVATGRVRAVASLPEGNDWILAVPGGGYAAVDFEAGMARVQGRPGKADTTWTPTSEPVRTVFLADVVMNGSALLWASLNATTDSAWYRREPLDGGPATPVTMIAVPGGIYWPFALEDGSLEYIVAETATGWGWYRVPPGGGPGVRLGDAPVRGAAWWTASGDGRRLVAMKNTDRPDVFVVRNFAELLRR